MRELWRCTGEEIYEDTGKTLCFRVVGAALAVTLTKKGWKLNIRPGVKVSLEKDGMEFELFKILETLHYSYSEDEAWITLFNKTGISETPLSIPG